MKMASGVVALLTHAIADHKRRYDGKPPQAFLLPESSFEMLEAEFDPTRFTRTTDAAAFDGVRMLMAPPDAVPGMRCADGVVEPL